MYKIVIKKEGKETNSCQRELLSDAQAWLNDCETKQKFGELGTYTVEIINLNEQVAVVDKERAAALRKIRKEIDDKVREEISLADTILRVLNSPNDLEEIKGAIWAILIDYDQIIAEIQNATTIEEIHTKSKK